MSELVEVTTQEECDREAAKGNTVIVLAGFFIVRDSSQVRAYGSSQVTACCSSQVSAYDSSQVRAYDSSQVTAYGSSQVTAYGSSQVRACGNVFIRLYSALSIKASSSVIIHILGKCKSIKGGIQIKSKKIKTIDDWCDFYGAKKVKDCVILYKAVDDNYMSMYGTCYKPKTKPEALDWDGGKQACGKGLHFSASPREAREFFRGATKFVACPIKKSEIAIHPNCDSPEKVKARAVSKPCYEVDIDGVRI